MSTLDILQIELDYYSKNQEKISACKDILIELHGMEGYLWIKDRVAITPKVKPIEIPHKPKTKKQISLERKRLWNSYKRKVQRLTEKQPLHLLDGYEKREFKDHHVDHIVSIFKAYKLGWSAEQCADISNLQMLPHKENTKKGIN